MRSHDLYCNRKYASNIYGLESALSKLYFSTRKQNNFWGIRKIQEGQNIQDLQQKVQCGSKIDLIVKTSTSENWYRQSKSRLATERHCYKALEGRVHDHRNYESNLSPPDEAAEISYNMKSDWLHNCWWFTCMLKYWRGVWELTRIQHCTCFILLCVSLRKMIVPLLQVKGSAVRYRQYLLNNATSEEEGTCEKCISANTRLRSGTSLKYFSI